MEFSLAWLSDPQVFAVNRLPACSDHAIYHSEEEAELGVSSLVKSLSGEWRAHFAVRPSEADDSIIADGSKDASLKKINVPCEFQMENPEWDPPHYVNTMYPWDGWEELRPPEVSEIYNPTVTAVRTFSMTESDLDCGRIVLTFGAVEPSVAVWLNGKFLGYSEDSFTPHRFDVTAFIHAGENRLVARIFKRCTGNWMESQDFWRFSGIQRDVILTFEGKTHLEDIFVHTPLNADYTHADVQAEMKIHRPAGRVILKLIAPDGTPAGEVSAAAAEEMTLTIPVENPALWNGETPNLYTVIVVLDDEVSRFEIGIREFAMKNGIMCLNGKRIVFHGMNRHEFDCDTGRVMSMESILRDVRELKRMNVNAVRTCHYPNEPLFYRLCDRYGLYVIDETNMESHGSWGKLGGDEPSWVVPGNRADWQEMVYDRGRSMVERDKNHASVLIWSCGNESFGGLDIFNLSEWFRQRDPSRIVHYEGIFHDRTYNGTSDMESRMYAKVAEIEEYLNNDPDKPFINCEYCHAMGNSCGGLHLYRELEDKYPLYQGGFIWDFVDQALRTVGPNGEERFAYGGDYGDRPTDYQFNTNGILLGDRSETPKVQEVRRVFQYANLTPDATGVMIRNDRVFTSLSDCDLTWKLLADGIMIDEGRETLPEILPGESAYVPCTIAQPEDGRELMLVCALVLREDAPMIPAGTAIATGWTQLKEAAPAAATTVSAKVIEGDYSYGINTGKIKAQFGRKYRGMTSLKDSADKEMVLRPQLLSLFRAPTDNDMGCGYDVAEGIWAAFSRHCAISAPELLEEDGLQVIRYGYTSPAMPGVEIKVSFICREDAIDVRFEYPGAQGQPDPAAMGLAFRLDPRLTNVEYYGFGPDASYTDRRTGALPGVWKFNAREALVKYCQPQENGSRWGVRSMKLTDKDGHGLIVEAVSCPLEISVQPWLPEELAACSHPDELVTVNRTVLDIAMWRRGIGGDDSWGAPTLPQFTYPADKPYSFTFRFRTL